MLHSNYLKQLDLQDIVLFLTLLEQRNAKRTAEIMNVSQPTVSYGLKRLRNCFDDVLFSSAGGVLAPSSKAENIAPYLKMVVESVNRCAEDDCMSASGAISKVWQLCAPEYFELSLLPYVLSYVVAESPGVSLHLEKLGRDLPVDKLMCGDLDLAIGFGPGYHQMHPDLAWESILTGSFVCLASHVRVNPDAPISLDEFCATPNVFPTPWASEKNMVDSWLETIGRSRNILAKANSYQAAINILSKVPAILALPSHLVSLLNIPAGVRICQPPHGFPIFTIDMVWSRERSQSQEFFKLREHVKRATQELTTSVTMTY